MVLMRCRHARCDLCQRSFQDTNTSVTIARDRPDAGPPSRLRYLRQRLRIRRVRLWPCGPVGLFVIARLRYLGLGPILAIDPDAARRHVDRRRRVYDW
jgi:hypothetical protein